MRRVALAALLFVGCEGDATHEWTLRFVDADTAALAAVVEARVRLGGCEGEVVYEGEVPLDGAGPVPPRLADGPYGFEGEARDASCAAVARGCVEVELPTSGAIAIPLESVDEGPACAVCSAGRCRDVMPDAGDVPDAGTDAGPAIPPGCDAMRGASCYAFPAESLEWAAAEESCVAWGGHLVTVDDADEDAFVLAGGASWIGLNDRASEEDFIWADGSPLVYSNWTAPPERSPPDDCVATSAAGWSVVRCSLVRRYACER